MAFPYQRLSRLTIDRFTPASGSRNSPWFLYTASYFLHQALSVNDEALHFLVDIRMAMHLSAIDGLSSGRQPCGADGRINDHWQGEGVQGGVPRRLAARVLF